MSKKAWSWFIIILVIAVIASAVYFNRDKIFKKKSPFEYIKILGATITTFAHAGGRYDYKDYGFYANNRAIELPTGRRGTYDMIKIVWDDGTSTLIKDVFK